jgi:hypothetical protein
MQNAGATAKSVVVFTGGEGKKVENYITISP